MEEIKEGEKMEETQDMEKEEKKDMVEVGEVVMDEEKKGEV